MFIHINSSISNNSFLIKYTVSMSKNFYFKQFSLALVNKLVLFDPLIGSISGATTPSQSGPGSDGNERVLRIPQSSYPGHSL